MDDQVQAAPVARVNARGVGEPLLWHPWPSGPLASSATHPGPPRFRHVEQAD